MFSLSVIVPVYNSEKYLQKCIDSLRKQTFKNISFWLVNDGSSDSSKSICEKAVACDKRFHLINQDNSGPGMARETGIKNCDGDYISFVDADDWIDCEMFEKMMSVVSTNAVDLVRCNTILHRPGKTETRWTPSFCDRVLSQNEIQNKVIPLLISPENEKDFDHRLLRGCVGHVIKKSVVTDNNIHFSRLKSGEDVLFIMEVMLRCKGVFIMSSAFYHYMFYNNQSLSKSLSSVTEKQRFSLRSQMVSLLRETDSFEIVKHRWEQEDRRLVYLDARIVVVYSGLKPKEAKRELNKIVNTGEAKKAFNYKIPLSLPFPMFVLYWLIKHRMTFLLYHAIRFRFRKELKKNG